MSERYEQPQNRDRHAREVLLAAMSLTEGRTQLELATALGKSDAAVAQMLGPLQIDGCVVKMPSSDHRAKKWLLTGKPLPEKFTSTCRYRDGIPYEGLEFDDTALCMAMGVACAAFGAPGPALSGRAIGARLVRGPR